jgi:tRNA G26 N,N-dimethylase Trm1
MNEWEPQGFVVNREAIKENVRRHHRMLNRLEPHLGCVVCRGLLIDGICPTCDPELIDGVADTECRLCGERFAIAGPLHVCDQIDE